MAICQCFKHTFRAILRILDVSNIGSSRNICTTSTRLLSGDNVGKKSNFLVLFHFIYLLDRHILEEKLAELQSDILNRI